VTATAKRATAAIDWATLMNRPAAYIDVSRLSACFDDRINLGVCERLHEASRLQERLSTIISEFYALAMPVGPEAVSPIDQTIALLPVARIDDIVRRAGAVYWANAIANVVRAEEVRWLHNTLGQALCTFALANRNLAGPPGQLELQDGADTQIAEDGRRCLGAWCQSQPDAVGGRVRLKSPASVALDSATQSPFDQIGPAIIRCAAS